MAQYEKGEKVICTKFDIYDRMVFDKSGFRIEKYVEDRFFNREATITKTWKECGLSIGQIDPEDKEEYEIKFTDNGESLAWVDGKDLVKKKGYMSIYFDNDGKVTAESIIAGVKTSED